MITEPWRWVEAEPDFVGWEISRRLPDGSTAVFGANQFLADDGQTIQHSVEIEVFRKRNRRSTTSGQITGGCGLESAGFFLEALTEFERYKTSPGDRIQAVGYDGRRYRAYHKVLGKRGYSPTRFDGQPCLVKIVQ